MNKEWNITPKPVVSVWFIHFFTYFDHLVRFTKIYHSSKNTKAVVCSLDGDINFFNIITGVLLADTLIPYFIIICPDYIVWMLIDLIIEYDLTLKNTRSRRYPTETVTDINYTYNLVLLVNAPTQAETLLHSLEQAAGGIDLHMNGNKSVHAFSRRSPLHSK